MSDVDRAPKFSSDPSFKTVLEGAKRTGATPGEGIKPKISDKVFDGLRDEDRERTEYWDDGNQLIIKRSKHPSSFKKKKR